MSLFSTKGDHEKVDDGESFQCDCARTRSEDFQGGDRGESGESDSVELAEDVP